MASEAPPFWWTRPDWRAYALSPLSLLYGLAARYRLEHAARVKVDQPVLCVGNLTVGGAGKTPVAIALALEARRLGRHPGFLSRGHGGGFSAPHLVDAERDSARHAGDEPLLLARVAPVAITADRAAGARLLADSGCDFLIMDDGFQSARIHMDYALIVVDAHRGLGNGHTIPGGPMRAPLVAQLRRADGILKLGRGDAADGVIRMAARAGRPAFEASVRPVASERLAGRRFLAFAGIGNPAKFFETVAEAGGLLAATRAFPDHHLYSDDDLEELAAAAASADAALITTAKDAVRLRHGSATARDVLEALTVLDIETVFELDSTARRIVDATLAAWRERRLRG